MEPRDIWVGARAPLSTAYAHARVVVRTCACCDFVLPDFVGDFSWKAYEISTVSDPSRLIKCPDASWLMCCIDLLTRATIVKDHARE